MASPDPIAQALTDVFISPNVADSNLEPANVVDALAAIARSIDRLAAAVEKTATSREDGASDGL